MNIANEIVKEVRRTRDATWLLIVVTIEFLRYRVRVGSMYRIRLRIELL